MYLKQKKIYIKAFWSTLTKRGRKLSTTTRTSAKSSRLVAITNQSKSLFGTKFVKLKTSTSCYLSLVRTAPEGRTSLSDVQDFSSRTNSRAGKIDERWFAAIGNSFPIALNSLAFATNDFLPLDSFCFLIDFWKEKIYTFLVQKSFFVLFFSLYFKRINETVENIFD